MSADPSAPPDERSRAEIPLFPLNTVLFPHGPLPLRIFEPRYVDMVRQCMRDQTCFGVVLIRVGQEVGAVTDVADIGTSARIVDFYQLAGGLLGITCVGERKFRIVRRWQQDDGLNRGEVEWLPAEHAVALPSEYDHLGALLRRLVAGFGNLYEPLPKHFDDASWVGCRLAEILPFSLREKQACLEIGDPIARLARLAPLIHGG